MEVHLGYQQYSPSTLLATANKMTLNASTPASGPKLAAFGKIDLRFVQLEKTYFPVFPFSSICPSLYQQNIEDSREDKVKKVR